MKVLITLLIATTISSCSFSKGNFIEPLCLPTRPLLEDISIVDQRLMKGATEEGFTVMVTNDIKLKSYVSTIEKITVVHNEQFKAKCQS